MKLSDVIKLYKIKEEDEIEIREKIEFEDIDINIGTRVLLSNGKRRRIVDLGLLSIAYKCNKNFVNDYLDLSYSLEDIHKKYNTYTELEFISLYCEKFIKDKDLLAVAEKIKTYILARENKLHGF
ncbi:hypothetical protein DFR86_08375 [Acidianus sulfidivorans JP7]|uniref:Uncharacterized protein n=1 Tax=Acidianus sulfidivorans JP7 TaxID=619593 RepID=A0A2U9INI0_9CREN|nr:hypothetical protein [Acidianus sulfidivorans]AWR97565.1 hypothetical protein DFR86_08375 [Acidianus sulfidivorans JP7]